MKIKNGFMLRKVGNQDVVVAVGEASRSFNGIIRLNESGSYLWQKLLVDITKEQLVADMLNDYDIDEATAMADVSSFVVKLREADILE